MRLGSLLQLDQMGVHFLSPDLAVKIVEEW